MQKSKILNKCFTLIYQSRLKNKANIKLKTKHDITASVVQEHLNTKKKKINSASCKNHKSAS